jgi:hypothetical protein
MGMGMPGIRRSSGLPERGRSVVGVGLLLALAVPAWGIEAFTSLGQPGDVYDTVTSQIITLDSQRAVQFTANWTGHLSSLRIPLRKFVGVDGSGCNLVVSFRAPGTDPTGTVLESWTILPASVTFASSILVLPSAVQPVLIQSTKYWVQVAATCNPATGSYGWPVSVLPGFNGFDFRNNAADPWR